MLNWSSSEEVGGIKDDLLNRIRKMLPVIDRTLDRFGAKTLNEYFGELILRKSQSLQSPDDLVKAAADYVAPILGEQAAKELSHDLRDFPVILTANHHGVDYFAQSFQGNWLFWLYRRQCHNRSTVVPVFSCGGVPLSNSSYPKGILLYDAIQPDSGELPFKLPVFPNNLNQTTVHAAPRFNENMVKLALKQLEQSFALKRVSRRVLETVGEILQQEYLDPLVLKQPNYSAQATLINNRLGKKIFTQDQSQPELIYIEFERVTTLLLRKDLINPDSLAFKIFFDPPLRTAVIKKLNGKKGCWNLQKITGSVIDTLETNTGAHLLAGYGSIFFWGLDVLGRHYPLSIIEDNGTEPYLAGRDGFGEKHRIPFNPYSILAALDSKMIFPSLFTMFTVVSLARAVTCVGGYFQSDYLPAIQNGLVQALKSIEGYRSYAEAVAGVTTDIYLSGMMFLLAGVNQEYAVPAGPIEIISRGGLKDGFFEELGSLPINAAHQIGLFNIYPDLVSRPERIERWQTSLAFELNRKDSNWVLPEAF